MGILRYSLPNSKVRGSGIWDLTNVTFATNEQWFMLHVMKISIFILKGYLGFVPCHLTIWMIYIVIMKVMEGSLDFPYCMNNTSRMWFSGSGKGADDRKLIIERSFFIWEKSLLYSNFMHQSDNLFFHQYHVIFMHFLKVVSYII